MTPAKRHSANGRAAAEDRAALVSVYGRTSHVVAGHLDRLAAERGWSRARMVAHCIEQALRRTPK